MGRSCWSQRSISTTSTKHAEVCPGGVTGDPTFTAISIPRETVVQLRRGPSHNDCEWPALDFAARSQAGSRTVSPRRRHGGPDLQVSVAWGSLETAVLNRALQATEKEEGAGHGTYDQGRGGSDRSGARRGHATGR